jgi:hypothetical protein
LLIAKAGYLKIEDSWADLRVLVESTQSLLEKLLPVLLFRALELCSREELLWRSRVRGLETMLENTGNIGC